MIPVHMRDDDVGHLVRANPSSLHGVGGLHVVDGFPSGDELFAIEPGIHEHDTLGSTNELDHECDIHAP